jgi:hypothetical protein
MACGAREASELINDLHVWFRSFRVKLSRMCGWCVAINHLARPVSREFQRNSCRGARLVRPVKLTLRQMLSAEKDPLLVSERSYNAEWSLARVG